MSRDRWGVIWTGLGLIGLGVAFILAQFIGWDKIWPIFPLFGGLAFLGGYAASGFRESGFVFVGVGAVLIGLFFFGFSLGYWEWGQMSDLWPAFPIIGGLAFGALFFAERGRDFGTLGVGCVAVVIGLAGFGVTLGYLGEDIWRLWPLLLILMGVTGLVGAFWQMFRRE